MRIGSLLILLVSCTPKESPPFEPPASGPNAGILTNASNYLGAFPAAAPVTYSTRDLRTLTVDAYPGQVQVFFATGVEEDAALAVIGARGAQVLSKVPRVGYYLVGVTPGDEAAFISGVAGLLTVRDAVPNVALELRQEAVYVNPDFFTSDRPVPLNVPVGITIIDGDPVHAEQVAAAAAANGGTVGGIVHVGCETCPGRSSSHHVGLALAAVAQGNAIFNPGAPTVVNLSWGPEIALPDNPTPQQIADAEAYNRAENEVYLRGILAGAAALPAELTNDLVMAIALGNSSVDLSQALAGVRADAAHRDLLARSFGLVRTDNLTQGCAGVADGLAFSNFVAGADADVITINNAEAHCGTSFASPAVAAMWWQLIAAGVPPRQAMLAAKTATDSNGNGQIDLPEANQRAAEIQSRCGDFACEWFEEGECTADCGACGDGNCGPGEMGVCALDCGSCGNGRCESAETLESCPEDCGSSGSCGDFICDAGAGETASCPSDCPSDCGDGFCNLSAGEEQSCPADCPESQCCLDTGGCPSEGPYNCGETCCCCGAGQVCHFMPIGIWACGAG